MTVRIIHGDCRELLSELPDESVSCVVTSPPYWQLRDYGVEGQIGIEKTPEEYVARLVDVFRGVRRVLRADGALFLNMGDTYAAGGKGGGGKLVAKRRQWTGTHKGWRRPPPGYKEKDITLTPFAVADRLRAGGWYLRSVIIWGKGTATEPPRADRPQTAHEYVFLLAKSRRYYAPDPPPAWYRSTVWTIRLQPTHLGHPAAMPAQLAERCVIAGCPLGGTVLDPFAGSGTTGIVADRLGRDAVLIELNPDNCEMARKRIHGDAPLFAEVDQR